MLYLAVDARLSDLIIPGHHDENRGGGGECCDPRDGESVVLARVPLLRASSAPTRPPRAIADALSAFALARPPPTLLSGRGRRPAAREGLRRTRSAGRAASSRVRVAP